MFFIDVVVMVSKCLRYRYYCRAISRQSALKWWWFIVSRMIAAEPLSNLLKQEYFSWKMMPVWNKNKNTHIKTYWRQLFWRSQGAKKPLIKFSLVEEVETKCHVYSPKKHFNAKSFYFDLYKIFGYIWFTYLIYIFNNISIHNF